MMTAARRRAKLPRKSTPTTTEQQKEEDDASLRERPLNNVRDKISSISIKSIIRREGNNKNVRAGVLVKVCKYT